MLSWKPTVLACAGLTCSLLLLTGCGTNSTLGYGEGGSQLLPDLAIQKVTANPSLIDELANNTSKVTVQVQNVGFVDSQRSSVCLQAVGSDSGSIFEGDLDGVVINIDEEDLEPMAIGKLVTVEFSVPSSKLPTTGSLYGGVSVYNLRATVDPNSVVIEIGDVKNDDGFWVNGANNTNDDETLTVDRENFWNDKPTAN
ncbi:MAG: hypothetical protein ACYTF0_03395 [Planctomycetota bacterium]|jgi:hypothetical protein